MKPQTIGAETNRAATNELKPMGLNENDESETNAAREKRKVKW